MSLIVFSHGNSFPASTYRVMLDSLRARGFGAAAIEKYGHDPRYPVTDNWPHLVQQLADFAAAEQQASGGQAPILVGHSLGGILSLMCAARHPGLARAVVMLDSPVLGGWRAGALRVVKRTALMARFSPSQVSRRRRDQWDDREAVFQHFRGKRQFARWDEQVLHDYVDHGTLDADGTWRLAFDREVESRTLPPSPAGHSRRPLQGLLAALQVFLALVDPRQRGQRPHVVGVAAQHPLQHLGRRVRRLQFAVPDLRLRPLHPLRQARTPVLPRPVQHILRRPEVRLRQIRVTPHLQPHHHRLVRPV